MRAENERRLSIFHDAEKPLDVCGGRFDARRALGMPGIEVGKMIEMSEFYCDAPHIVPDAAQYAFDFGPPGQLVI